MKRSRWGHCKLAFLETRQVEPIKKLIQAGESLEFKRIDDRRGRALAFDSVPPPATDLGRNLLKEAGIGFGDAILHLYSGTVHGTAGSLIQDMQVVGGDEHRGLMWSMPVKGLESIETDVTISLIAWERAFDRYMLTHGYSLGEWEGWRAHVYRMLMGRQPPKRSR